MDSVFRNIHIENNAFDYCIMWVGKTIVFFENHHLKKYFKKVVFNLKFFVIQYKKNNSRNIETVDEI